jgi:hypothetical protein
MTTDGAGRIERSCLAGGVKVEYSNEPGCKNPR